MYLGSAPRGPPDRAFRPQVRPGGDLVQPLPMSGLRSSARTNSDHVTVPSLLCTLVDVHGGVGAGPGYRPGSTPLVGASRFRCRRPPNGRLAALSAYSSVAVMWKPVMIPGSMATTVLAWFTHGWSSCS